MHGRGSGHLRRSGHRDHRRRRGRRRRRREGLARLIDELELRARRRRRRRSRHGMHHRGMRRRRGNHDHRLSHRRRRRRLWRRAGMLGRRRRRRRARGLVVQRLDGHPRQDPPALLERRLHEVVDDVLLDDHRPRGGRDGRIRRRLGSKRHDDVARRGRRYGAVVTRRGHARRDHSAGDRAPIIPDACNGRGNDHPLLRRGITRGGVALAATGGNSSVGSGRSIDACRPQLATGSFQYLSFMRFSYATRLGLLAACLRTSLSNAGHSAPSVNAYAVAS